MKTIIKHQLGAGGEFINGLLLDLNLEADENNAYSVGPKRKLHPPILGRDEESENQLRMHPRTLLTMYQQWDIIEDYSCLHWWHLAAMLRLKRMGVNKVVIINDDTGQADLLFWHKKLKAKDYSLEQGMDFIERWNQKLIELEKYTVEYCKLIFDTAIFTYDKIFTEEGIQQMFEHVGKQYKDEYYEIAKDYKLRNDAIIALYSKGSRD